MTSDDENTVVVEESGGAETSGGHVADAPANADDAAASNATGKTDETLADWVRRLKHRGRTADKARGLPVLPEGIAGDQAGAPEDVMQAVRRFHQGSLVGGSDLQVPGGGFVPALLHPFRDASMVRHEYPLALLPPGEDETDGICLSLSDLLKGIVEQIAPDEDEARMLKDNLARMERHVGTALKNATRTVDARSCLDAAADAMLEELALAADSASSVRDDLRKLIDEVSEGAALLTHGTHSTVALYVHAARHRATRRRGELREEIRQVRNRLRDLLRTEQAKDTSAKGSESSDPASASFIDTAQLSKMMGQVRGAAPMAADRRQRIEAAIETLERHLADEDAPLVTVISAEKSPLDDSPLGAAWKSVKGDICNAAAALFDEQGERYAGLFGALRTGRLELADAYDPTRHDALLEAFGWTFFTDDELRYMPPMLAIESVEKLTGPGMFNLSRLLLSGRVIDVLVPVHPEHDPRLEPDGEAGGGSRFELAYLGVSHRDAQVHQSSSARPRHLTEGFLMSLDATCPALHVISNRRSGGDDATGIGDWLHAAAALEGRAHPFFHYNPEAGSTWARRLDFAENPQPEIEWPVYELPCTTADGEEQALKLGFTFADFALLEMRYRGHYRIIPEACGDQDELTRLDEYLAFTPEAAEQRVPFIWAVDDQGRMHRLVVSRDLVVACRDRLDYWRTLQELSGVRNEYVREAVERERERMGADFEAEKQKLAEAHATEIDRVREETAAEALGRLAQALLGSDVSSLAASVVSTPAAPSAPPPPAEAEPAESEPAEEATEAAPAEEEDEGGFDEPWIDSALCTSCNDCINMNSQLFVYNANKQAMIGDPSKGTFAELVKAAEICPARCIHPGKPLDPSEPNLEELIERARPFN